MQRFPRNPTPSLPTRGLVYLAVDDPEYLKCCALSIASMRRFGFSGLVTVFVDEVGMEAVRRLQVDSRAFPGCRFTVFPSVNPGAKAPRFASRFWKTQIARLSPYQRTLYLDADTLAIAPFFDSPSFRRFWDSEDILSGIIVPHVTMVVDALRPVLPKVYVYNNHVDADEWESTVNVVHADQPHYNTGLMLWDKCHANTSLFDAWHAEWCRWRGNDGFPMHRAIGLIGAVVDSLPSAFNGLADVSDIGQCGMVHFSLSPVRSTAMRRMSAEELS
jgi:hypothetical protein